MVVGLCSIVIQLLGYFAVSPKDPSDATTNASGIFDTNLLIQLIGNIGYFIGSNLFLLFGILMLYLSERLRLKEKSKNL